MAQETGNCSPGRGAARRAVMLRMRLLFTCGSDAGGIAALHQTSSAGKATVFRSKCCATPISVCRAVLVKWHVATSYFSENSGSSRIPHHRDDDDHHSGATPSGARKPATASTLEGQFACESTTISSASTSSCCCLKPVGCTCQVPHLPLFRAYLYISLRTFIFFVATVTRLLPPLLPICSPPHPLLHPDFPQLRTGFCASCLFATSPPLPPARRTGPRVPRARLPRRSTRLPNWRTLCSHARSTRIPPLVRHHRRDLAPVHPLSPRKKLPYYVVKLNPLWKLFRLFLSQLHHLFPHRSSRRIRMSYNNHRHHHRSHRSRMLSRRSRNQHPARPQTYSSAPSVLPRALRELPRVPSCPHRHRPCIRRHFHPCTRGYPHYPSRRLQRDYSRIAHMPHRHCHNSLCIPLYFHLLHQLQFRRICNPK